MPEDHRGSPPGEAAPLTTDAGNTLHPPSDPFLAPAQPANTPAASASTLKPHQNTHATADGVDDILKGNAGDAFEDAFQQHNEENQTSTRFDPSNTSFLDHDLSLFNESYAGAADIFGSVSSSATAHPQADQNDPLAAPESALPTSTAQESLSDAIDNRPGFIKQDFQYGEDVFKDTEDSRPAFGAATDTAKSRSAELAENKPFAAEEHSFISADAQSFESLNSQVFANVRNSGLNSGEIYGDATATHSSKGFESKYSEAYSSQSGPSQRADITGGPTVLPQEQIARHLFPDLQYSAQHIPQHIPQHTSQHTSQHATQHTVQQAEMMPTGPRYYSAPPAPNHFPAYPQSHPAAYPPQRQGSRETLQGRPSANYNSSQKAMPYPHEPPFPHYAGTDAAEARNAYSIYQGRGQERIQNYPPARSQAQYAPPHSSAQKPDAFYCPDGQNGYKAGYRQNIPHSGAYPACQWPFQEYQAQMPFKEHTGAFQPGLGGRRPNDPFREASDLFQRQNAPPSMHLRDPPNPAPTHDQYRPLHPYAHDRHPNLLYREPAEYRRMAAFISRRRRKNGYGPWPPGQGSLSPADYSSLEYVQSNGAKAPFTAAPQPAERSPANSLLPSLLGAKEPLAPDQLHVLTSFAAAVRRLDLDNVTVVQLKTLMKEYGLVPGGKKNELIQTVMATLRQIESLRGEEQPEPHGDLDKLIF